MKPSIAEDAAVRIPTLTEEQWQAARARTDQEWQRVQFPAGWSEFKIEPDSPAYGCRAATRGKTSVLFSADHSHGKWWLHVSVAHPEKTPTYLDIAEVKRIFVGDDRQAVQIFPAAKDHVNIHTRALHLWACLEPEGDGLPQFGSYGTI